jgi:hypothetical protein
LLAVRWYLRYGLSYGDLEELLAERGIPFVLRPLGAARPRPQWAARVCSEEPVASMEVSGQEW